MANKEAPMGVPRQGYRKSAFARRAQGRLVTSTLGASARLAPSKPAQL
eukprot:CAMPEP_0170306714 /NCGR_PEP_ID=MMETSP0116_2-20130129/53753_1 /TAXON_ID=400756 /ORGANISM="Durinskia baltica, Strain CSIRO CS-38" /LENGTH=47 /DNA_ID= /DNA_START= /DNA_END= /DNA_ORIENTATION=